MPYVRHVQIRFFGFFSAGSFAASPAAACPSSRHEHQRDVILSTTAGTRSKAKARNVQQHQQRRQPRSENCSNNSSNVTFWSVLFDTLSKPPVVYIHIYMISLITKVESLAQGQRSYSALLCSRLNLSFLLFVLWCTAAAESDHLLCQVHHTAARCLVYLVQQQ